MSRTPSRDDFLQHVAGHQMTVNLDARPHRHLVFRAPDSGVRRFELVTWPMYLAYVGDMGSFVFCRTQDMFEFFRGHDPDLSYWSEKLEATDRGDGHRSFSPELYRAALRRDFEAWDFDTEATRERAWNSIVSDGLDETPESIEDAMRRISAYQCPHSNQRFEEFWDHQLTDYTYRFVWCCDAISWGIERYDELKASPEPAAATPPSPLWGGGTARSAGGGGAS